MAPARRARVAIPTLTAFEKSGTLVNQQFRLQKFHRAVPPRRFPRRPGHSGPADDLVVLAKLIAAVGGAPVAPDLGPLWETIAAEVPALKHDPLRQPPRHWPPPRRHPLGRVALRRDGSLHHRAAQPVAAPA